MPRLLLIVFALLSLASGPALGQCASGTVTAELSNDPGFVGLYKYCLTLDWSLDQYALSHPDLFIGLEDCECVCDPSVVQFGDPAGHSTSSENGDVCENDYYGDYVCMGDPSLPAAMNGPAVKWEPYPSTCEPGTSGSGTFCFYSPLPPGDPMTHSNAIAIKHGQETCYGDIQGVLPLCDCTVESHHSPFGHLKSVFGESHPQD